MSRATVVPIALAITVALLSACSDDECPGMSLCGTGIRPPIIVAITPSTATAAVGSQATFAVGITGGSAVTPPTLVRCETADSSIATVTRQTTACVATAIAPGATSVLATSSIGSSGSATLTVVPRD